MEEECPKGEVVTVDNFFAHIVIIYILKNKSKFIISFRPKRIKLLTRIYYEESKERFYVN